MLLRAKWRPHYGVLPSGLNLSYYAVYCRKGSTLGSHPKPQSMFKVLPRPPANYPSYSVSVPKIIQFLTFFFFKVAGPLPQIPDNFLPVPKHIGYCVSEMGSLWTKGSEP